MTLLPPVIATTTLGRDVDLNTVDHTSIIADAAYADDILGRDLANGLAAEALTDEELGLMVLDIASDHQALISEYALLDEAARRLNPAIGLDPDAAPALNWLQIRLAHIKRNWSPTSAFIVGGLSGALVAILSVWGFFLVATSR